MSGDTKHTADEDRLSAVFKKHNDFAVEERNTTPTDVSQFMRLGCARYMRLRLVQKEQGDSFLYDYDVAPQAITPLLTAAGLDFERRVEQAAAAAFASIHCADPDGENAGEAAQAARGLTDNALVAERARLLGDGEILLLFQPRLAALLGIWSIVGDADVLRLNRDDAGQLHILIVDIKSTAQVKTEHRLQVAFYAEMIREVLAEAAVPVAAVNIGILYRGPADGGAAPGLPPLREAAQRNLAKRLLGVDGALLEVIADMQNYTAEVRDLLVGDDAQIVQIAEMPFSEVPYSLGLRCDGCLFNEFCMKDSHERGDLSAIPYITDAQKQSLQAEGVCTVGEVAGLMQFAGDDAGNEDAANEDAAKDTLTPAERHKALVRRLLSGNVGPHLEELVLRARRVNTKPSDPAQENTDQEGTDQEDMEAQNDGKN